MASVIVCGPVARAQAAPESEGLSEIIVTAQKREQSLQDVPIAVTALTGDALSANRVYDVTDLTGLAPGLTVRTAAGGSKLPQFVIRGAFSGGLVPGSDKQVSIYLDGVYLSAPRGSIFDMPNVERIEVLRGPQGTLFGRNATAGAISVSTRDPMGEVHVRASTTVGNYDHWRFQTSVDLPQVGPFSGYFSFVHNEKRGDIRNAGEGQVWDRSDSAYAPAARIQRSPKYLGSKDANSWFAALKFESGNFKTVYKFDRTVDRGTPDGTGLVGLNTGIPLLGSFLDKLISSQTEPVNFASDGRRPKGVNNAWVVPLTQKIQGHSVTSSLTLSDSLSIKNIFAFRKTYLHSTSTLDGFSSLPLTSEAVFPYATFIAFSSIPGLGSAPPANQAAAITQIANTLFPLVGSPFVGIAGETEVRNQQYSDELQINFDSDFLTATAGAVWFHSKDWSGETQMANTVSFSPLPGGVLRQKNVGSTFNKATSIGAYAQLELHVTPEIDLVGGARITRDKKSGNFVFGNPPGLQTVDFSYKKTKPNFLLGVNYKPSDDLLLYGKFSTAFVSGGSVAGIPFQPETAKSWEAGLKAEFLDRKVRANLALYTVTYKHFQVASSGTNYRDQITEITGNPALASAVGSFVVDQGGPVKANGFELDLVAAPVTGLSLGGSLAYTKTKFKDVSRVLLGANGGTYLPVMRPDWNAGLWAQFDSPTISGGETYVSLRADASWTDYVNLAFNPDLPAYAPGNFAENIRGIPANWRVNARVALKNLNLGGVKSELAAWSKNLTNSRVKGYGVNLSQIMAQANYTPARTYGLDLTIDF
ncbi:MAG: TonB-dependent receptor [Novosphingobium sp.]|nr:TonB-dependent receptor [Novosphingobium sp.]